MRRWMVAALAALVLAATGSIAAHHSFASFWHLDKTVAVEGVVTEVRLVNPHPIIKLEAVGADGTKAVWTISSKSTGTAVLKSGWTTDTLKVGARVKIEGNPPRQEGSRAMAAGKITNLADGSVVWFGGGGGIPEG